MASKSKKPAAPKAKPKRSGGKRKAVETKGDTVEVDIGQPQLNLPKARDLKHHFMTIMGLKAKCDEANGRYRKACQEAKESGIDVAAITQTMKWEKKDPLDMQMHFQQLGAMFKERGTPVQLATYLPKFGTPEEEGAHRGRMDAEAGRFAENPYPEGSAPAEAYSKAFGDVQASRVSGGEGDADRN